MAQREGETGAAVGQRTIGAVPVGAIGLGCAALSIDHADDPARGAAAIRTALDAGMTLLDTALVYTTPDQANRNERFIRQVLDSLPDKGSRVLVATKGGHHRDGWTFPVDGRPETLRRHCELSLRALGVPRIDLYHLHWPDPQVPIAESVGTLAELQREGKIARIGVSNVDLRQLAEAERVATIASVQNGFSLFHQDGRDVLDHCTEAGIAFLAYSPVRGLGAAGPEVVRRLAAVATDRGVSRARVALAWLLAQSPRLIPISGSTRPESIRDSAAAATLVLTEAELASLDPADDD